MSDGHDVYEAAREEYRKKIRELAEENERLRAALVKIDLLNTPLHGWSMSDLIDQEIVASGIRALKEKA